MVILFAFTTIGVRVYCLRMHKIYEGANRLYHGNILPAIPVRAQHIFKIETLAYTTSFLCQVFTLDQIRIIWFLHNAGGVSMLSWSASTFSSIVWLFYGAIRRDTIIFVTSLVWVVLCASIVVGIGMYR